LTPQIKSLIKYEAAAILRVAVIEEVSEGVKALTDSCMANFVVELIGTIAFIADTLAGFSLKKRTQSFPMELWG
jgi:hypothetical protein